MDHERFLRQIVLAEIGEDGQRAIGAAEAALGGDGLAHEVASTYALRAGFAGVTPAPAPLDPGAPDAWVADPAARAVLAGSRAAVRAVSQAIAPRKETS